MIDWEHEYYKLREWIVNLSPHCDTCRGLFCSNECALIQWQCDPKALPKLEGDKEVTDGVEV